MATYIQIFGTKMIYLKSDLTKTELKISKLGRAIELELTEEQIKEYKLIP